MRYSEYGSSSSAFVIGSVRLAKSCSLLGWWVTHLSLFPPKKFELPVFLVLSVIGICFVSVTLSGEYNSLCLSFVCFESLLAVVFFEVSRVGFLFVPLLCDVIGFIFLGFALLFGDWISALFCSNSNDWVFRLLCFLPRDL